jgi:hypothetical protein
LKTSLSGLGIIAVAREEMAQRCQVIRFFFNHGAGYLLFLSKRNLRLSHRLPRAPKRFMPIMKESHHSGNDSADHARGACFNQED